MNIFNKSELKMSRGGLVPMRMWNALVDLVWALAIVSVNGGTLGRSVNGSSISVSRAVAGGGGAVDCALGRLTANVGDGNFTIEPGYVHGGGDDILLEKTDIVPAIGSELYVEVSWTATAVDDVLQAGGVMTGAVLKVGMKPVDDVLSATSLTGKHYRTLGEWVDDGAGNPLWVKAGCGSYSVRFCPSGWTGLRGGI